MQITSLLKSVSRSLPGILGADSSDDGYSSGSDTSDDSSDISTEPSPATETRHSELSTLINASRPASSPHYLVPILWGYQSSNEHAVFSIDEMPTYSMPDTSEVENDMDRQTLYQGSSDPFVEENEDLRSQLLTGNPWRTLARFRNPPTKEHLNLGARFPLLRLPVELLLIVAAHLPNESAACLALACKTTYFSLGNASFKMSKPDLWKFLLLIEHERQNSYACSPCLTLHRPPESYERGRYRCCMNRNWLTRKRVDLVLPDTITPGLVKMIGRKWLEDPRACEEYLSWIIMRAKKTTRYIKLATHVIPRMLDGSLVLRTETYIHAFVNGHLTERTLIELAAHVGEGQYLHTHRRVPDLCGHQKWASCLPNLTTLKKRVKPTKCDPETDDHYHRADCYSNDRMMRAGHDHEHPIEMCDFIHEQPCRAWKIEKPSSKTHTLEGKEAGGALRPKLEDTYDGEIMGCRKCTTDFCVSAREVPGLGYCLVLTTWKDLGGVGTGFSDKWNHHVRDFPRRSRGDLEDVRSEEQVGQAYEAFESLERSHLETPQRYRPQPDHKMIRDLTRRVWKSSYSINRDDTTDTNAGTDFEEDEGDL